VPIVQAPMAGVSTPQMAAAVSSAGALGSIGVGAAADVAAVQAMLTSFRSYLHRDDRLNNAMPMPLNVNVFCHRPAKADVAVERAWIDKLRPEFARYNAQPPEALTEIYRSFVAGGDDSVLDLLVRERPRVVSFHFGVPSREHIRALHGAGIVLLGTATSLAEARVLVDADVDVIVAQGYEAGGHRGVFDPDAPDDQLSTMALVQLLVRSVDRPVIAAGGLMDGAGIAAALKLGAAAAQLGTAFIACNESLADSGYRAALLQGDAAYHTTMTRAISGRPARCLANRFTAIDLPDAASVPAYPIAYDLGKQLNAAAKAQGEHGYGAQWAGQGAPLVRSNLPAGDLVRTLLAELNHSSHS